jgi:hypothetical protein
LLMTQSCAHAPRSPTQLTCRVVAPHARPLCCSGTRIALVMVLTPTPQLAEQVVLSVHVLAITQSIGHRTSLHGSVWVLSLGGGHDWPPLLCCTQTSLVRVRYPGEAVSDSVHSLLHTLQSDHSLISQSTGQSIKVIVVPLNATFVFLTHASSSRSAPHAVPPKWEAFNTLRVRVLNPAPAEPTHEISSSPTPLQPDQSLQVLSSQSSGQGSVAQDLCWYSSSAAHCLPPYCAACVWLRVRWVVPVRPPDVQVLSQSLHVVDQSPNSQSMGQVCLLHLRISRRWGQALPPCFCSRRMLRRRACSPPPQDLEHVVHWPKVVTRQSTGQSAAPHSVVSDRCGHFLPP